MPCISWCDRMAYAHNCVYLFPQEVTYLCYKGTKFKTYMHEYLDTCAGNPTENSHNTHERTLAPNRGGFHDSVYYIFPSTSAISIHSLFSCLILLSITHAKSDMKVEYFQWCWCVQSAGSDTREKGAQSWVCLHKYSKLAPFETHMKPNPYFARSLVKLIHSVLIDATLGCAGVCLGGWD